MLLSRLFLVFLAVGSATARWRPPSEPETKSHFFVNVTDYYHPPGVLYDGLRKGGKALKVKKPWAHEGISSLRVALRWKQVVSQCTGHLLKRSVHFLGHFQAPMAKAGEANLEVYFIFTFDPLLKFRWDASVLNNPGFQHVRTIHEIFGKHSLVYKMDCQPGSVFPIGLMVLDADRKKEYSLTWARSPDLQPRTSLEPQLVKLVPGIIVESETRELTKLEPVVEQMTTPFDIVPLSSSISESTITKYALHFKGDKEYFLEGYFKAEQKLTRFLLSAEAPTSVEISGVSLLKDRQAPIHTLFAHDGVVSEELVKLRPGMLHRITISGSFHTPAHSSFMLQVSTPENILAVSDVNLMIPSGEPQALQWQKRTLKFKKFRHKRPARRQMKL